MTERLERRGFEVRRPVAADVPWLLDQLRTAEQSTGAKRSLIGDDALNQLHGIVAGSHPCWLVERDESPCGFLIALLAANPLNPAVRMLWSMFFWVEPAHRGSRAAALLLDRFVAYGKRETDLVTLPLNAGAPIKRRSLERRGFRLAEMIYVLEP